MGNLKHVVNLFLGVGELKRAQKFLDDDGHRLSLLKNSGSFGVIKVEADTGFNNFKVEEDGPGSGNIKIATESIAIDNAANFIRQSPIASIAVTDDSNWYWIQIAHQLIVKEEGTIQIDINGNITGTDTKFTEVLRGGPNFPSKIKLTNSSQNTIEYSVVEVIDDTNALLAGTSFLAESDQDYEVIGTFTPGHVPPSQDKNPFQYDGCIITQELETVVDTAPAKTAGIEFFIARVKNTAGTVLIEDKRIEQYKTTAEFNLSNIIKIANPLIGVESVMYSHGTTVGDKNRVTVGFGMRTAGWTLDAIGRSITFADTGLLGGKYKATAQFSDDELNGWRIYLKDGSYLEIVDSIKTGSAIKCIVKEVDPSKFTVSDILTVVPAVDQVEIKAVSDGGTTPNVEIRYLFEAASGFGLLELPVPELPTYAYRIVYRYVKGGETTEFLDIPTDVANGYYNESAFNSLGVLTTPANRTTYTSDLVNGYIVLTENTNSISAQIGGEWVDFDITGTSGNLLSNDLSTGEGSDVNLLVEADVSSHFKYRIVGKTVSWSMNILDFEIVDGTVTDILSIVIKDLPWISASNQSSGIRLISPSHQTIFSNAQLARQDEGSNKIFINMKGLALDGVYKLNYEAEFSSTTDFFLSQGLAVNTGSVTWRLEGEGTFEIV